MENVENDDYCMSIEEWIEVLEASRSMDVVMPKSDKKDPLRFYFIMCEEDVVMIEKQHWAMLIKS